MCWLTISVWDSLEKHWVGSNRGQVCFHQDSCVHVCMRAGCLVGTVQHGVWSLFCGGLGADLVGVSLFSSLFGFFLSIARFSLLLSLWLVFCQRLSLTACFSLLSSGLGCAVRSARGLVGACVESTTVVLWSVHVVVVFEATTGCVGG